MRSLLLLIISACSCLSVQAQDSYVNTWALKGDLLQLTDAEISVGASAEYRFHPQIAFQLGAGYSFQGTRVNNTTVSGFRLRPELRIYMPSRRRNDERPPVQPYVGIEMNIKRVNSHYRGWVTETTSAGANYQRLVDHDALNFAYGTSFRFGWQLFAGPYRNLLVDFGLGAGILFNNVTHSISAGDRWLNSYKNAFFNPFSDNLKNGLSPAVSMDLRIGYRFSKKT
jgi:hypothetical protein